MINTKHTEGKIRINHEQTFQDMTSKSTHIIIETDEKTDLDISTVIARITSKNKETAEANASRIVEAWNGWDEAKELLSEFVKILNHKYFGNTLRRMAIIEKTHAFLRRNGGEF